MLDADLYRKLEKRAREEDREPTQQARVILREALTSKQADDGR